MESNSIAIDIQTTFSICERKQAGTITEQQLSNKTEIVFEKATTPIEMNDTTYCASYQFETIFPYVIRKKDEVIGYLFAEKSSSNTLYIQFIEILDSLKEQGLGTEVVNELFDAFEVLYLEGRVMTNDGDRAYYFWDSLGSELSVLPEDYDLFDFENDIEFILKKPSLSMAG